jgi:hypothetical protein
LQLAFQYTVLVPEPFGEAGADGKRPVRYIQSRRLRLRTMSLRLATSAKEVYAHAAPDVILALVQHKIVRASLEEGLAEGRALLQVRGPCVFSPLSFRLSSSAPRSPDIPIRALKQVHNFLPVESLQRIFAAHPTAQSSSLWDTVAYLGLLACSACAFLPLADWFPTPHRRHAPSGRLPEHPPSHAAWRADRLAGLAGDFDGAL